MAYTATFKLESTRPPATRDYLLFYLGLPVLYALWMTGSGIRFVSYMSFWNGFIYMSAYILVTWWFTDLCCRMARYLLRFWRVPLWVVLIVGFHFCIVPLGTFYTISAELLARNYPEMAPFTSNQSFSWSIDYVLHFARYSIPWLVTWFVVIYGYRFSFGVSWYERLNESARDTDSIRDELIEHEPTIYQEPGTPQFLGQSRLPADAKIYAINAAEHYIRVWSDRGTDMIRYRFRDALNDMQDLPGMQVHRSWWIDDAKITDRRSRGRSLQVTIADEIDVPVSLAYREKLMSSHSGMRLENDSGVSQLSL